jgi:uncharacterized protein
MQIDPFQQGVDLFNRGHFFDAHEVLEDFWRSLPREPSPGQPLRIQPLRVHAQGMVQLAVAFHHASKGNHVGAHSVLERALRNLAGAETSFPHLDLDLLRSNLRLWQKYLDRRAGPAPPLPMLMITT